MTKNVGSIDKILRVLIGAALIAFAVMSTASWAWVGWIGIVPLVTAFVGTCPAYSIFGISSKGK